MLAIMVMLLSLKYLCSIHIVANKQVFVSNDININIAMNKFNGNSSLNDVHNIYQREVRAKEVARYHKLVSTKGYDCWGFVNASKKYAVKLMLQHTDLPYSSELASLIKTFLFGLDRVSDKTYSKVCSMSVDNAMYKLAMTGYIA